ncbi:MAG: hypothetical protein E4H41_02195 [Gemmatimonadales bacterium]|nr:MAG: hypothetical protein E4H41_02195 [Gemmatimonadales bacterium]
MRSLLRLAVLTTTMLGGTASVAAAQGVPTGTVDSLRRTVTALTARLDSLDAGHCPAAPPLPQAAVKPTGNAAVDSLAATVAALTVRVNTSVTARCAVAATPVQPADAAEDPLAAIRAAADSAAMAAGAPPAADTAITTPTVFVSRQRNQSSMNPEISATGDVQFAAQTDVEGLDLQLAEVEVSFQATLDPYSATKIFLTWGADELGVEEAYIYWTGLPGRFRADVGKYRMAVGELNRWHRHALPETNYPLVYQAFLSPDGLAGVGASFYTTLPVSIAKGTSEIFLQAAAIESESLNDGGNQPALLGRLQNFWQLSRSTYVQLGFTGIAAQNGDSSLKSSLFGADLRFTYRPPDAGTRKEITWRTEGYRLQRLSEAPTTTRYGMYSDLSWRLSKRWVVGGRYDYVEAPVGPDDATWRATAVATWWQSEFVYLRLQAFRNHLDSTGSLDNLTLQVVWAMGPHKHEIY